MTAPFSIPPDLLEPASPDLTVSWRERPWRLGLVVTASWLAVSFAALWLAVVLIAPVLQRAEMERAAEALRRRIEPGRHVETPASRAAMRARPRW